MKKIMIWIKGIIYLLFSISGLTLFKLGASSLNLSVQKNQFSLNISWLSILGLCFYVISFLLWLIILKDNDLSYVFPIFNSLGILFSAIVGILIFSESISVFKIIGIIFVIAGVIFVGIA